MHFENNKHKHFKGNNNHNPNSPTSNTEMFDDEDDLEMLDVDDDLEMLDADSEIVEDLREIISNSFNINIKRIYTTSSLRKHLGLDIDDFEDLIVKCEEKFDIEIPSKLSNILANANVGQLGYVIERLILKKEEEIEEEEMEYGETPGFQMLVGNSKILEDLRYIIAEHCDINIRRINATTSLKKDLELNTDEIEDLIAECEVGFDIELPIDLANFLANTNINVGHLGFVIDRFLKRKADGKDNDYEEEIKDDFDIWFKKQRDEKAESDERERKFLEEWEKGYEEDTDSKYYKYFIGCGSLIIILIILIIYFIFF